jgi:hypothetical protein
MPLATYIMLNMFSRTELIRAAFAVDSIALAVLVLMPGGVQDNARDAGAQSLTFILLEEAKATSVSQCTVGCEKTKFQP